MNTILDKAFENALTVSGQNLAALASVVDTAIANHQTCEEFRQRFARLVVSKKILPTILPGLAGAHHFPRQVEKQ